MTDVVTDTGFDCVSKLFNIGSTTIDVFRTENGKAQVFRLRKLIKHFYIHGSKHIRDIQNLEHTHIKAFSIRLCMYPESIAGLKCGFFLRLTSS